ncbi:MAG: hypothetical protein ACI9WU_004786, partial [Myxococcota bacterium]
SDEGEILRELKAINALSRFQEQECAAFHPTCQAALPTPRVDVQVSTSRRVDLQSAMARDLTAPRAHNLFDAR